MNSTNTIGLYNIADNHNVNLEGLSLTDHIDKNNKYNTFAEYSEFLNMRTLPDVYGHKQIHNYPPSIRTLFTSAGQAYPLDTYYFWANAVEQLELIRLLLVDTMKLNKIATNAKHKETLSEWIAILGKLLTFLPETSDDYATFKLSDNNTALGKYIESFKKTKIYCTPYGDFADFNTMALAFNCDIDHRRHVTNKVKELNLFFTDKHPINSKFYTIDRAYHPNPERIIDSLNLGTDKGTLFDFSKLHVTYPITNEYIYTSEDSGQYEQYVFTSPDGTFADIRQICEIEFVTPSKIKDKIFCVTHPDYSKEKYDPEIHTNVQHSVPELNLTHEQKVRRASRINAAIIQSCISENVAWAKPEENLSSWVIHTYLNDYHQKTWTKCKSISSYRYIYMVDKLAMTLDDALKRTKLTIDQLAKRCYDPKNKNFWRLRPDGQLDEYDSTVPNTPIGDTETFLDFENGYHQPIKNPEHAYLYYLETQKAIYDYVHEQKTLTEMAELTDNTCEQILVWSKNRMHGYVWQIKRLPCRYLWAILENLEFMNDLRGKQNLVKMRKAEIKKKKKKVASKQKRTKRNKK